MNKVKIPSILFSLMVAGGMASSVNVTASDVIYSNNSIVIGTIESRDGLNFDVSLESAAAPEGVVVAAVYDEDGDLIKLGSDQAKASIEFSFEGCGDASYVKVMWWNSLEGMVPMAATETANIESGTYVLMNIPYDEFYASELGAEDKAVDAVSSATLNKPRTGTLAAGSYHVDPNGSDISGVIYPVFVSDKSKLEGYTEITDESSVDITVVNRGKESKTTYSGRDALFESASYSYYELDEKPAYYKNLITAEDGKVSFSAVSGRAATVSGAEGEVTVGGRHADIEIKLTGTEGIAQGDTVSAVVLTSEDGSKYGLRHVANIWRATELGWNCGELDIEKITNIRYYTQTGVYDYPVELEIGTPGYVLMNIPYESFYTAEGISARSDDSSKINMNYDAVSSATNKTGNYGKSGGAYHSAKTAEIDGDGAVTAVGADNNSINEGVTWPVFVTDISELETLGGVEITDTDEVTVATFGRGATSSTVLNGYKAINEAPSYSYYMLGSKPAYYMTLNINDGDAMFAATSGRATVEEEIAPTVKYGVNWGDVQLGVADAVDAADKQINAVVITAETADGETVKAGLIHLYNVWSYSDMAWRNSQIEGLNGAVIKNIRYYCNNRADDVSGLAYYIYDYPTNIQLLTDYDGEVTAEFNADGDITLSGLPDDIEGLKAQVYHTTGGRNAVLTYLTPLAVDPDDDDIDPVSVDVTDGIIQITEGTVTNNAGITKEYGVPLSGTTYTIALSSDNYAPMTVQAVYE